MKRLHNYHNNIKKNLIENRNIVEQPETFFLCSFFIISKKTVKVRKNESKI